MVYCERVCCGYIQREKERKDKTQARTHRTRADFTRIHSAHSQSDESIGSQDGRGSA